MSTAGGGGSGGAAAAAATGGAAPPPPLRLKVLSIGDEQVGKSCLIKRYCENKFTAKYIPTIGVDYGVKPARARDRDARINFFDLSGAEAYAEIRNEFFKDASAALLVFAVDNRDSFAHLDNWLRDAKACGMPATIPLVLAGNKCENKRVVTTEEAKRYAEAKGMPYYEVSASTGQEVAAMFDSLFARAVDALPPPAAPKS